MRLKRETQGAFCVLNANAKSQTRKSMKINVICTVVASSIVLGTFNELINAPHGNGARYSLCYLFVVWDIYKLFKPLSFSILFCLIADAVGDHLLSQIISVGTYSSALFLNIKK